MHSCRVDAKGRPTYFNAAGASITGYANLDELRAAGKDLHYALQYVKLPSLLEISVH